MVKDRISYFVTLSLCHSVTLSFELWPRLPVNRQPAIDREIFLNIDD